MADPQPPAAAGPPPQARLRTLRRIAITLAVMLGAVDLAATAVLFVNTSNEADQRKAENCKLFVGRWRADVQQIAQTVNYIQSLSPAERRSPLNRRVAANLPTSIDRAIVERPPAYCELGGSERRHARAIIRVGRQASKRKPTR